MIVDASAVLAVLFDEPEAAAIKQAPLALRRLGDDAAASARFDEVIVAMRLRVAPFGAVHAAAAQAAWLRYGKGSGHVARLNFGDCLVYGFAKVEGETLLFKGDDFSQTDIVPALAA